MITAISAAIMGFLLVILSLRVVKLRRHNNVPLGHGDKVELHRAIRAQANFSEYTPMTLILLFIMEMLMGFHPLVIGVAVVATIGRVMHAYGISKVDEHVPFRMIGMWLTFAAIIVAAVAVLVMTFANVPGHTH